MFGEFLKTDNAFIGKGAYRAVENARRTQKPRDAQQLRHGERRALFGAFQSLFAGREILHLARAERKEQQRCLLREIEQTARLGEVVRRFAGQKARLPRFEYGMRGARRKNFIQFQPSCVFVHNKLLAACPRVAPAIFPSGSCAQAAAVISPSEQSASADGLPVPAAIGAQL